MQTTIVVLILAGVVIFLIRRFRRIFDKAGAAACECGCGGCAADRRQNCDSSDQPGPAAGDD